MTDTTTILCCWEDTIDTVVNVIYRLIRCICLNRCNKGGDEVQARDVCWVYTCKHRCSRQTQQHLRGEVRVHSHTFNVIELTLGPLPASKLQHVHLLSNTAEPVAHQTQTV